MDDQPGVVSDLDAAGVLAGIRWAFFAATDRVLADHSDAAGHDATWLGITRFVLFRDRLDRVFACGRYAVPAGSDPAAGLDVLRAELTAEEVAAMPLLAPGLVVRADLNGSPGWAWHEWRWLLASCAPGRIEGLPWSQMSPTKRRIANQHTPTGDQGSLFDHLAAGEVGGLLAAFGDAADSGGETLVVAHSLDPLDGSRELVLGSPRPNSRNTAAWHWRRDLLPLEPADHATAASGTLSAGVPDDVPDAPVRLRPRGGELEAGTASTGR